MNQIKILDEIYSKNDVFTIMQGKLYKYLDITLDLRTKESVAFLQHDAIKKF